tara:strand:- start:1888 stop:2730 length:843 start_codon:yes stop_codon:yes gene_type:complete
MAEIVFLNKHTENLAKNSKKSYLSAHRKLLKIFECENFEKQSNDDLITGIQNYKQSTHSKQVGINVLLLLKREVYGQTISEFETQREKNNKLILEENKTKSKDSKLYLPKYQELIDHLDVVYDAGDWRAFIVNYILLNYHTRDMDISLNIITNKKDINADINYIMLTKKKATYVRNQYKTVKTHGAKTSSVTDVRFIDACHKFLKEVSSSSKGALFPSENVNYWVSKSTCGGLGEGNIYKICVNHFKGDLSKLKYLCESRGSSLDTLVQYYDLDCDLSDA